MTRKKHRSFHHRLSKGQGKKDGGSQFLPEITVYDFADSEKPSVRPKKGSVNAITMEVKEIRGKSVKQVSELAWDERENFDFDSENEDLAEKPENTENLNVKSRRKTKKTCTVGITYPVDIWYQISRFILPEDTGRFAAICQGAHAIVCSARFWINLYKRYYKKENFTSAYVKPEYVLTLHGLRCRVIRALFHVYPPFKESITSNMPFKHDTATLHGSTCILMWHRSSKNYWQFYFKFRSRRSSESSSMTSSDRKRLLLGPPDVHLNGEEGCCVLEVIMQNFVSIPPTVMGQTLHETCLSVGHGMRYHKLKLVFAGMHVPSYMSESGTTISLDPVVNLKVLNWWDPRYPCSGNTL